MTSMEYKLYLFVHSQTFFQYILPVSMAIIGLGTVYIKNGKSFKGNEHIQ